MVQCAWCGKSFTPRNKSHIYCCPACAMHARADRLYFGGHKRESVGFDECECWVCERAQVKRMATHHVIGKRQDDLPLVELCPGCHKLVELLSIRRFLDDEKVVANLITLARFKAGLPDARTVVQYQYT